MGRWRPFPPIPGGRGGHRVPWAQGFPTVRDSLGAGRVTWASLRVAVLVLGCVSHTQQAPIAGLRIGAGSFADAEAQLTVPGAGRPRAPGRPAPAHCVRGGIPTAQEVLHQRWGRHPGPQRGGLQRGPGALPSTIRLPQLPTPAVIRCTIPSVSQAPEPSAGQVRVSILLLPNCRPCGSARGARQVKRKRCSCRAPPCVTFTGSHGVQGVLRRTSGQLSGLQVLNSCRGADSGRVSEPPRPQVPRS